MTRTTTPLAERRWATLAVGAGAALAATALNALFWPLIKPSAAPLFFAAVVVSASYGGCWPGVLTAVMSALIGEVFFYPPFGGVDTGSVVRVGSFAFVALLVSSLNARAQAARREAEALAAAREELLLQEQTARSEAEMANRAKDEFLATLSHELRTPLNAMLGWLWWLRRGGLDGDRATRALDTIERNTRSLAQLIEDMLDVSRIITGKLRLDVRPVDLGAVVEGAVEALRPAATAKAIAVNVILVPGAGRVTGDPDRLQQVMWNLLSNAIKFTPEKGCVTVRLAPDAAGARITVSDTGKGVSAEMLPRIFDRFRQDDGRVPQGGLGLGLSIVRHIVELHGGSVCADSEGEGRGTTFVVRLPGTTAAAASASADHETDAVGAGPDDVPALKGIRILVVDDERDARDWVSAILRQRGAEVTMAGSVGEALATLASTPVDVLVSDIRLPGEDGYDLIRQLRERELPRGRHTPAIALTGYPRVEDRGRALSAGYQMHVPKPVEAGELVSVVATLVARVEPAV